MKPGGNSEWASFKNAGTERNGKGLKDNEDYLWRVECSISTEGIMSLWISRRTTTLTNTGISTTPPNWCKPVLRIVHKSKIEKQPHR